MKCVWGWDCTNTWRGAQPRAIWKAIAHSKMWHWGRLPCHARNPISSQMALEAHIF